MTRVSHHEPDILLPCKLQRGSHMLRRADINRVGDIIAKDAGGLAGREGVAALIGEEQLHDARRRREAGGYKVSHRRHLAVGVPARGTSRMGA